MDPKMAKNCKLTKLSPELRRAYSVCHTITRSHYENFPVASVLLPLYLRRSISAIYAFARLADDISDEGDFNSETRLEMMTKFETNLYAIQYGKPPTEPVFIALKHTIECFNLPIQLFYDLLIAFRQDILKNRYQNFAEVLDYCHYSANPIGRLLLHLAGQATPENLHFSDSICTGLQLINFIQDIEIDLVQKNRCYIPADELQRFNLTLDDLVKRSTTNNYAALIQLQIDRARACYIAGIPLGKNLPGFFGLEIRFIIASGYKILQKLAKRTNFWERPTLTRIDMLVLLVQTMCNSQKYNNISLQPWDRDAISPSVLSK